ncbi:MAG: response regulator [Myxococcota bacterium]
MEKSLGDEERVLVQSLRACLLELEDRGISPEEVARSVGVEPERLADDRSRISWNLYCDVMALVVYGTGGLSAMRAVGHRVEQDAYSRRLARTLRAIVSPQRMYLGMIRFVWPYIWPDLELDVELRGKTNLALTVRVPDELRPCPGWFAMAPGVLERAPTLFALESSLVEADVDNAGRHGTFVIEHAASGTIWIQMYRALRAAFTPWGAIEEHRQQVGELNARLRQLTTARNRAEDALSLKERFLTNVSHELRTPLGGAMGLVDMLRSADGDLAQDILLDEIQAAHLDLLRKLEIMIDMSLLMREELTLAEEPFSVEDVLRGAADGARAAGPEGADISVHVPSSLVSQLRRGDRQRVKRIVEELTRNALSYGGSAEIRVVEPPQDDLQHQGGGLLFEVSDEGPGMDEATRHRALEAFRQGDDTLTRAREGLGLGLPLVAALARSMSGTLEIDSAPGQGTRCRILLPLAWASEPPPALSGDVLVVDDNRLNRRILTQIVSRAGYEVREAQDGEMAIRAVLEKYPAVILMDCQMPVMDGLEATRRIRTLPGAERIRIAAVTAHAQPGYAATCLAAGMDVYWTKPVERQALGRWLKTVAPQ